MAKKTDAEKIVEREQNIRYVLMSSVFAGTYALSKKVLDGTITKGSTEYGFWERYTGLFGAAHMLSDPMGAFKGGAQEGARRGREDAEWLKDNLLGGKSLKEYNEGLLADMKAKAKRNKEPATKETMAFLRGYTRKTALLAYGKHQADLKKVQLKLLVPFLPKKMKSALKAEKKYHEDQIKWFKENWGFK